MNAESVLHEIHEVGGRRQFAKQLLNPHIFFDDQDVHVESVSEQVPTGKVLYRSDSTLRELQEERDEENGEGGSST